ncbi:MAG: hypothetical protein Q3M30_03075 [Candidatus Electrothrix sp. Rat3]|nr:hypothetical protein [Candidatus Electrothrix rattekaaiensis]
MSSKIRLEIIYQGEELIADLRERLDEGFGALDEDALETALETLAGLRKENKLIGVISHVGALKERIACQLEVVPGTGGQSVVQGAGVRRVR